MEAVNLNGTIFMETAHGVDQGFSFFSLLLLPQSPHQTPKSHHFLKHMLNCDSLMAETLSSKVALVEIALPCGAPPD